MTVSELIKGGAELFNKLSGAELKSALKSVQKAVGQQVRRLQAAGEGKAPALRALEKSGGRISAAQTSEAKMKSELQRGLNFMQSKTRTVTGARQLYRKQLKELGLEEDTPREAVTSAWEEYNKIKEEYPAEMLEQIYGSKYADAAHNIVAQIAQGEDPGAIRDQIADQYAEFVQGAAEQLARITNGL